MRFLWIIILITIGLRLGSHGAQRLLSVLWRIHVELWIRRIFVKEVESRIKERSLDRWDVTFYN
jgi:hypothetical protein